MLHSLLADNNDARLAIVAFDNSHRVISTELLYDVEDAKKYNYVKEFLSALRDSDYYSGADGVILEHKFDVTLIYDQKFRIRFGDVTGLDVKLRVLDGVLAEGSLQYADKASIDLSDPSAAIARPDPTLDLSDFVD